MFKLRKYQEKAIEDCMEVLNHKSKKSIAVLPTGAGKSIVIAECVKRLNKPVLILQPSKELLKQNYGKYINVGGKASIYCTSLKEKTIKKQDYTKINGDYKKCKEVSNVTYATIGSIKKEIDTLKKLGIKHVIIDEVHLQSKVGSQLRGFLKKLNIKTVLGLTATPIYLEGGMNGSRLIMINRSFATIFRDICHVTQIEELVSNSYWSPLKYKIITTDESSLQLNTSGSDYTEHSQKRYYEANNIKEQIVEEVKNLKKENRKRILIFVPTISEANELYSLIPNSAVVHSKLSQEERDFMVEEFTNGDIPVAINVNVLSVGYDNPEIDAIITARPTSSIALFYQQIGRGCRIHPDKENCIITDFSGNTKRFGRVEGLRFESIPVYGWGLFNEEQQLLTDYPISTRIKPTKETLSKEEKESDKDEYQVINFRKSWIEAFDLPTVNREVEAEFYFGKYKGQKLKDLINSNKKTEVKNYCIWIVEQYSKGEFKFYGNNGDLLKKEIFKFLQLSLNTN